LKRGGNQAKNVRRFAQETRRSTRNAR